MGAGDDIIDIAKSADVNTDIHLGKGSDTITFNQNDIGSATNASGSTIYGGAGADLLATDALLEDSDTVFAAFEYNADSESTLAAMDTIAVMATAGSGSYSVLYQVGGASQAVFSAAGATATNGLVVFSSTFDNAVTLVSPHWPPTLMSGMQQSSMTVLVRPTSLSTVPLTISLSKWVSPSASGKQGLHFVYR